VNYLEIIFINTLQVKFNSSSNVYVSIIFGHKYTIKKHMYTLLTTVLYHSGDALLDELI